MIIFKKIKISFINQIYIRQINTDKIYDLMEKMVKNETLKKANKSVSHEDFLEKMEKLKEKVELKKENQDYADSIQENLDNNLKIIKELRDNFKTLAEKSQKIDTKIEEKLDNIDKINIEKLNINNKALQDINIIDKKLENDYTNLENVTQRVSENASSIKKSIFDIEWLQPFFDFMHNHSTLVLTVGSGLVMGGMWYMNGSTFNIGSLLTRLGITIFSGNNSANSASSGGGITIDSSRGNYNGINTNESTNNNNVAQGFFRQLGVKVLELLDVFIDRMKENKQKYK